MPGSRSTSHGTAERMHHWARLAVDRGFSVAVTVLVRVGTFPYYRLFHFNTLGVIQRIALYGTEPSDFPILLRLLKNWRERKLAELQFISIACAVLAGAVIGSFSWYSIQDAFWLASACWYSSLVLSILGILLAAQQIAVFHFLGDIPDPGSRTAQAIVERYKPLLMEHTKHKSFSIRTHKLEMKQSLYRPKKTMIFAWQCPVMFMSYSVCLFLLGLTLLVITPLIRLREQGWNTGANVAIFYLATSVVAGAAFIFCSFWIYHFVDFESDTMFEREEIDSHRNSPIRQDFQETEQDISKANEMVARPVFA